MSDEVYQNTESQGMLVKYQVLITALVSCVFSLFLWVYTRFDNGQKNIVSSETNMLVAFEQEKNSFDKDLRVCMDGGKLSKSAIEARVTRRQSFVTEVMKCSRYISTDALFHLAIFSRFDDTAKYKDLCSLSPRTLHEIDYSTVALEVKIRKDLM